MCWKVLTTLCSTITKSPVSVSSFENPAQKPVMGKYCSSAQELILRVDTGNIY